VAHPEEIFMHKN